MSVESILMELARSKGRAVRDRGSAFADVVGGIAQAPAQYYAGRDQQRALELRQQQIQQQIALEQSRAQREEATAQRQKGLDELAQTSAQAKAKRQQDAQEVLTAAIGESGDPRQFDAQAAFAAAKAKGDASLVRDAIEAHRAIAGKVTEFDPKKGAMDELGNVVREPQPMEMTPAEKAQRDETARHNLAAEEISRMTVGRAEAAQRETERHNRATEATAQQNANKAVDKPPNQQQFTAATYAGRIEQSGQILDKLEKDIAGMNLISYEMQKRVPPTLQSGTFQSYDQAARNLVNAVLRRESGATVTEAEFENAKKQYLPQPGDTAQTLKQKKENRDYVFEGMKRASGAAYEPPPDANLGGAKSGPAVGERRVVNGQLAEWDGKGWKAVIQR